MAGLAVADGEALPFPDGSFDFVYTHGVIQYAAERRGGRRRVPSCPQDPAGLALFQVYNRVSWLHVLSKVMKTPLEHEDAPELKRYSIGEFRGPVAPFIRPDLVPDGSP